MHYLLWFDDTPRRTSADKIAAGIAAYRERFGTAPAVVLTHEDERVDVGGVEVRSEGYVRRNNFWIGIIDNGARQQ